MKNFVFGMDTQHPAECARQLREHGFDAVVMGGASPEVAAALEAEEIELYLSYGAYGVPKDSPDLAQDAFGYSRRWFNSGCPNDLTNAQRHLDAVLEKAAKLPTVRGILVDGARFASFASVEGIESFFTCFCPHCMQAMKKMGLDAEAIRETVGRLMRTRKAEDRDAQMLQQWLLFREKTVQQYMDTFAQRVHALRSHLLAGAFIFAPSLGAFVGQTAKACRSLDVVSHMLYRDFHQEFGVACLGHEWAALNEGFGQETDALIRAAAPESPFFVHKTPRDLLESGLEPEWVGREVAYGRQTCLPKQLLWPIIQIDDDRIHETARQARINGADGIGLFAYDNGELPCF